MMEDNKEAIYSHCKEPVSYTWTKHIDIQYYYVHEAVQDSMINLTYAVLSNRGNVG